MKAKNFFSQEDQQRIVEAIKHAEKDSSGEVRVHIENRCKGEVLDRAATVFAKLKMHKTELRNGVLFYLALEHRKFAILGDAGINAKTGTHFWDAIKLEMAEAFKDGQLTEGLVGGILKAGEQLKVHFPYQQDDVNELPDDISFS
ncbi:MAG TPA: TPM domain-containing protein [Williamwhitmania sp.]|nr:TPM domain-containing protein [Williamwhitmania sp.]